MSDKSPGLSETRASRAPNAQPPRGAAWANPLARIDAMWTALEMRLITFVLISLLLSLVSWVFLGGLSSPLSAGNSAGTVFRAATGAMVLGGLSWALTKHRSLNLRRTATMLAIAAGVLVAPLWRGVGIEYFDNMKSWLQEGSTLTLMGGLRGVATRLTLWLALLGASLATAAGKHIHIDVIFRFLPPRLRLPSAILNACVAAAVCFSAVWGFVDHVAIESFGATADESAGAKLGRVGHHLSENAFLTRKQIGLDLRSFPRVLAGSRYDTWMTAGEWNRWLKEDFSDRYSKEEVAGLLVPDDAPPHLPLVIAPSGTPMRGALVHVLALVFPFGLFMIGLRFLLRALLTISGHTPVDPDEAHREDLGKANELNEGSA